MRLASVGPDDVVRSLAGFDGELAAALPGELRERFYLPLLEIRRLLSDAVAVDLVQREQRVQFHAARPAGGRRATSRPPNATCAAWPTTATGSSSSFATPEKPAAPAIA